MANQANEFGGFRIDSVNPIRMTRLSDGVQVPHGENKQHLRSMARQLGLLPTGQNAIVHDNGDEVTTHEYANMILKRLRDRAPTGTTEAVRELLQENPDITAAEAVEALPDHNQGTVRTQVVRQRGAFGLEPKMASATSAAEDVTVQIARMFTEGTITSEQMSKALVMLFGR